MEPVPEPILPKNIQGIAGNRTTTIPNRWSYRPIYNVYIYCIYILYMGAKVDLDFGISDLVKNPDETDV